MKFEWKRHLFLIPFSAVMILMVLALYKPLQVQAANGPHRGYGCILVVKGSDNSSKSYTYYRADTGNIEKTKGLSYNEKTNTLTINNFNHKGWWICPQHMGDLKIVVKGTSRFAGIQHSMNTLVWGNSLTFSGSGKLILRSDKPNLGCVGSNAFISIGKNVKIDASNTGLLKSAMVVVRSKSVSTGKAFKISGAHSSGKINKTKFSLGLLSSGYRYSWSKKAFTKNGKAGGSSSSATTNKPAKMSFSSSGRSTKYAHGIYVKWNKVTKNAKGYQLQISKDSAFKNKLIDTTMGTNYVRYDFGYTKGYKLYVRIRAYNKVNGTRINGNWSAVKSFTVK